MDKSGEMEELAQRIDQVEARFAINDLVSRYCLAVLTGDEDAYVDLFTEDFLWNDIAPDGSVTENTGHDARRQNMKFRVAGYGLVLLTTNFHVVHFDSATDARGVVVGHSEVRRNDGEIHVEAVHYEDVYRCENGCWRFASRRHAPVYRLLASDYPARLGDPEVVDGRHWGLSPHALRKL